MENKNETTKRDRIKKFLESNADVIIGSGVSLVIGGLLSYKFAYSKGIDAGRDKILNEIVNISCSNGLVMVNPDLGSYVFTATKIDK